MKNTLVKKIIELAGSQSALGRAVGVKQQTVWEWVKKNHIPAKHVITIEKLLNGQITRHEMRPDIYPREDG